MDSSSSLSDLFILRADILFLNNNNIDSNIKSNILLDIEDNYTFVNKIFRKIKEKHYLNYYLSCLYILFTIL